MLSSQVSARAGAAVLGVALGLGGTGVIAFAATRPPATPSAVTSATDAPSPGETPAKGGVGPDATGPAAFGLCRAWTNHHKHDDGKPRAEGSVAMRNLVAAAGGEDKVEAYCAAVPHPGQGAKADKGTKAGKDAKAGKGAEQKEDGKAGRSGKDKPGKDKPGKDKPGKAGTKDEATASPTPSGS